jgi:hypothetical protein
MLSFIVINIKHIAPKLDILYLLTRKQLDFIGLVHEQQSGSIIPITPLSPNVLDFIKNIPQALFNTTIRPLPWNWSNPMIILASVENLCILFFIVLSIVFIKPIRKINTNMLLFALSYVLILYTLIGWITPVMGSIVRYKIPAIPFLLFACILVLDYEKLKSKFPFLNKLII